VSKWTADPRFHFAPDRAAEYAPCTDSHCRRPHLFGSPLNAPQARTLRAGHEPADQTEDVLDRLIRDAARVGRWLRRILVISLVVVIVRHLSSSLPDAFLASLVVLAAVEILAAMSADDARRKDGRR
jgi:hypothetical protein